MPRNRCNAPVYEVLLLDERAYTRCLETLAMQRFWAVARNPCNATVSRRRENQIHAQGERHVERFPALRACRREAPHLCAHAVRVRSRAVLRNRCIATVSRDRCFHVCNGAAACTRTRRLRAYRSAHHSVCAACTVHVHSCSAFVRAVRLQSWHECMLGTHRTLIGTTACMLHATGTHHRTGLDTMAGKGAAPGRTPGFTQLPYEGRHGDAPAWPLDKFNDDERTLWNKVWTLPQAIMWERMRCEDTVALYVRLFCEMSNAASPSQMVKLGNEVRQLDSKLGLSPRAMLDLRWEVEQVEQQPASEPNGNGAHRPFVPKTPSS